KLCIFKKRSNAVLGLKDVTKTIEDIKLEQLKDPFHLIYSVVHSIIDEKASRDQYKFNYSYSRDRLSYTINIKAYTNSLSITIDSLTLTKTKEEFFVRKHLVSNCPEDLKIFKERIDQALTLLPFYPGYKKLFTELKCNIELDHELTAGSSCICVYKIKNDNSDLRISIDFLNKKIIGANSSLSDNEMREKLYNCGIVNKEIGEMICK
ncbi:MAG: hypothetical protein Q4P22_06570, partial [Eubacteriales bacterium]|nr:hypothetical protein [Eubacteriales bacterium]